MPTLTLSGLRSALFGPVDLTIAAGGLVLLSGPSGAGKSLLLRAIADLDPHDGEAAIDDLPRSRLAPSTWRRRVGLLPAEPGWWDDLVGPHFDGLTGADGAPVPAAEVDGLLAAVGFAPDVRGWDIGRLSTGERQRLALARLLALRPAALLLDEPTANLDPDNARRVERLLTDYRQETAAAVLWVSHDPDQRARLGGQLGGRLGGRQLTINGGRLSDGG